MSAPVEFNGAIFDKTVVRARRLKLSVKTFSLPDVGPGSIIEYSYRLHWHRGIPDVFKHPEGYILDGSYAFPAAHWVIQQDLFADQEECRGAPSFSEKLYAFDSFEQKGGT